MNYSTLHNRQTGFSLIELLAVLALFGILCTVAVSNITVLENPLASASANLTHYFRLVRSRAISQTRSIRITPNTSNTLIAESATSCSDSTFSPINDLSLDLGTKVRFGSTNWSACFTQRGLAHAYTTFTVTSSGNTKTVQIALGGGVKIQ
jgi:prepilin-type N-terminal cleavage/methylation domain-containing protein